MPTLSVFNSLSLDGYFTDSRNDMSWAHAGSDDLEFAQYTARNASGERSLKFSISVARWHTRTGAYRGRRNGFGRGPVKTTSRR